MTRTPLLLGLCVLGVALAGTVGWEYRAWHGRRAPPPPATERPVSRPNETAAAPVGVGPEVVAAILARPLFNPSRRPVAGPATAEASSPAARSPLPRLTGVLVSNTRQSAIFAGPDNGRSLVMMEGGWVGGYQVRSIRAGQVTVSGPEGTSVLRPAYASARPAVVGEAASAEAPVPSFRGLPGLPPPPPADPGKPSVLDQLRRAAPSVGIPGLPTPGATEGTGR